MNTGFITGNSHFTAQRRLNPQPNYSTMANPQNSQTYWETNEVFTDRKMARPWSDKTLIYPQSRVVAPTNKFGVKFIDPVDPTTRYCPSGMLKQILPKPIKGSHVTTKPYTSQYNTNL